MFTMCALIFYILQILFSDHLGIFSIWVIPDGVTLHGATVQFFSGIINPDELQPGWGAFVFYYPSKWVGFAFYFVINLMCLLIIAKRLGFTPIILFPYFIVAMALPSKDILILFLSLFFMVSLFNGRWLIALSIASLSYLIRDGALFVLLSIFMGYIIMQYEITSPIILVTFSFAAGALLFSMLNTFFGETFIVARNLSVYEQNSSSLLGYGSVFDYFVRVFGNATNLAFRPSLYVENGGISVVAISYFVSGISMLTSLICSACIVIQSKNKLAVNLATTLLISLAVISLNPFVQGRYLLPYGVIFLGYLIQTGKLKYVFKMYLFSVFISLAAMLFYSYSDIPSPPVGTEMLFDFFDHPF